MKKFNRIIFLTCGLLLTLAATSVFAQQKKEQTQPNKKPLEDFSESVKEKVESEPQERGFQPNKKPLEGFAQSVREKIDSKQVDLNKSFSVQLTGIITESGRLDPKTAKFDKSEGDGAMIEVGKSFIEAVSDTSLFYYLKQMGIEKIDFIVGQDDSRTYGVIASEQLTVEKAKTISSGMNIVVKMASLAKQTGTPKLDVDTEFLLNGITVSNDKKIVKIKFNYEKSAVQEMINRKLKENAAK